MARTKRLPSRKAKPKRVEICARITSLIIDYVTGRMKSRERHRFDQHMRICPDCVNFLNTYKTTMQATKSLRYGDIPHEMVEQMRTFLRGKNIL